MHNKIGAMIRHYRKKANLSQKALADRAGVGKTVVFDAEHGKPTIQFDTILKILQAIDVRLLFRTDSAQVEFKEEQESF